MVNVQITNYPVKNEGDTKITLEFLIQDFIFRRKKWKGDFN